MVQMTNVSMQGKFIIIFVWFSYYNSSSIVFSYTSFLSLIDMVSLTYYRRTLRQSPIVSTYCKVILIRGERSFL